MSNPKPDLHVVSVVPARVPRAGFRLKRLELFNWGTFHKKVAVLEPNCGWTLVVGENGSGKSTAVDALRTLLVPTRLLNFNDASGDQKKRDRTRKSYIRGAWATSSQEDSATAKTEYLRDPGEQSILLAVFANEANGIEVTLAQILWIANDNIQEIYAVARGGKTIREHLAELGQHHEIRKSLRSRGFEAFERFPAYEECFRSRLGIPGRGALEVFNQAIGVKEIADIDSFVRKHMLEPSEAFDFIDDHLKPHYKHLDACYQAIQKAKDQIAKLDPIVDCHRRIEEAQTRKQELEVLNEVRPLYYARRHLSLREVEAEQLTLEHEQLNAQEQTLTAAQKADSEQEVAIRVELNTDKVGLRIAAIEREMTESLSSKQAKERKIEILRTAIATMGKPLPFDTAADFAAMREQVNVNRGLFQGNQNSAHQKLVDAEVEQREQKLLRGKVSGDLESLRKHQVLIPREFVAIRQALCQATGIAPSEIPYAGELIEVKTEFHDWTGAIERLLHAFGISLVVPERHSLAVTRFINRQHLGLRFQFYCIPAVASVPRPHVLTNDDHVPARLNFREHPVTSWVKAEISRRFTHACCADEERLHEVDYGITREGLIRNGPTQRIKDDRHAVNDIKNYVLGWSIEAKIRALEKAYQEAEKAVGDAERKGQAATAQLADLERRLRAAEDVLSLERFADIDHTHERETIVRLQLERDQLEASSDRRKTLNAQLKDLKSRIEARGTELSKTQQRIGGVEETQRTNADARRQLEAVLEPHSDVDLEVHAATLRELQETATVTLDNVAEVAAAVGRKIQSRLNQQTHIETRASQEMLPRMAEFLRDYPEETADKKAEPAYAREFAALRQRLETDDLPRHQQEFEKFLSVNLIQDMALFHSKLDEHRKEIEGRLDEVNRALKTIAFDAGTHVQVVWRNKSVTDETSAFRAELKACIARGLNPSPEDRIQIFNRIRELIARFEKDVDWARRVTDARNWLEFGVREQANSDGREVNYYTASSGKSGGQKTRLAFTILASAITAQYGLVEAEGAQNTFRFVIIDEAFARTDEEKSERALELFKSLDLQLLVVSPFDAKSRIVEDYVDTFHLTLNPQGHSSHVHLASRQEYDAAYEERPARAGHAEA